MKDKHTGDYAIVGIHQGNIFLEANEWDASVGQHYVVTLYLEAEEAKRLADQMNLCATGVQEDFGSI